MTLDSFHLLISRAFGNNAEANADLRSQNHSDARSTEPPPDAIHQLSDLRLIRVKP